MSWHYSTKVYLKSICMDICNQNSTRISGPKIFIYTSVTVQFLIILIPKYIVKQWFRVSLKTAMDRFPGRMNIPRAISIQQFNPGFKLQNKTFLILKKPINFRRIEPVHTHWRIVYRIVYKNKNHKTNTSFVSPVLRPLGFSLIF